jgi:hypothetical protein
MSADRRRAQTAAAKAGIISDCSVASSNIDNDRFFIFSEGFVFL